jgi:hypothetical protein
MNTTIILRVAFDVDSDAAIPFERLRESVITAATNALKSAEENGYTHPLENDVSLQLVRVQ